MKMSNTIDDSMFAPCGMNCTVCYKHCYVKKSCLGCLHEDTNKPEHCRKCNIKDCTKLKEVTYCYECSDFPCKLIKNLEKSYNRRYSISLIENSLYVKEHGLISFLESELQKWSCECGGIISLHDTECSECKKGVGFNDER